jgi:hypothetical protein
MEEVCVQGLSTKPQNPGGRPTTIFLNFKKSGPNTGPTLVWSGYKIPDKKNNRAVGFGNGVRIGEMPAVDR